MNEFGDHAPAVTVVLPCYNAHADLPRALDSVRTQTFRDFEIIVVDDGSTAPATIAFLDALPDDVRLIRQKNRGLPGARNTGFCNARGIWVLPLDCDDWIDPMFLEKLLGALEVHPERSFAFAHFALGGEASGTLVKHYNFFEQLFFNQLPYCLLMRKSCWENAGGYDESLKQGYEDWELNIRLGSGGDTGLEIAEPLFHYNVSSSGMLLSTSSTLHGTLWRAIQRRNREQYRPLTLLKRWLQWRRSPSTYPLILYFPWLLLHRLLPQAAFSNLFRRLLSRSHSRRVTRYAG